jgi:GNAT superfamily N-acetyltransferase
MHIRQAQPEDTSKVAQVLGAAAAKRRARGEEMWSAAEVSEAVVGPHIREGLYHVAFDGTQAVGVYRLQLQDPAFWPEIAHGTSAFLHKLAVLPDRQGQGIAHALLAHAVGLTREKGLRFLRLDCMAGRPRLRAVYENFGFRHHSEKIMGNTPFDRFALDVRAPAA